MRPELSGSPVVLLRDPNVVSTATDRDLCVTAMIRPPDKEDQRGVLAQTPRVPLEGLE